MNVYVKGWKDKHIVLQSENQLEANLLRSWGKKRPVVSGLTVSETVTGKPKQRSELTISFEGK